jgi:hypothetical protein
MSMREALDRAMGRTGDGDAIRALHASGLAVADEDTMSQAIHDVYCGIAADHVEPNEKDHAQALAMIGALQKYAATRPPA